MVGFSLEVPNAPQAFKLPSGEPRKSYITLMRQLMLSVLRPAFCFAI